MNLKKLLAYGSLWLIYKKGLTEIRVSYRRLTLRVIMLDFIKVTANVGFVALPAFLIGLIFILLPQGRDTLLLVIEKMAEGKISPLIFLLISLVFWSISSELSVRYAIYVSDNSGKNLSEERVYFRKTSQKILAAVFLLWPFFIVAAAMTYTCILAGFEENANLINLFICLLLIYILVVAVSNMYFKKHGKPGAMRARTTFWGARSLSHEEYYWLQKLYGIYDDYTYTLPKLYNFLGHYRSAYKDFTDYFTPEPNKVFREAMPQDNTVLSPLRLIPKEFELTKKNKIIRNQGDAYKWIYCIPVTFYQGLHFRVRRLSLVSLGLLLLLSFIPVKWGVFGLIGAPALICSAFACYSGIYCGLLYIDKGVFKAWKVSVRFLLLLLFLFSSVFNNDHPVRVYEELPNTNRNTVSSEFHNWFTDYKTKIDASNSGATADRKYPVIFICAEGGALRTGAYTGLYLTKLEDILAKHYEMDLKNSVFAMSGVSGGAVGLGFYNAVAYRSTNSDPDHGIAKAKEFFLFDSLSPVVGKMLYGDFLNLFIPVNIPGFDRAGALEQTWEMAYSKCLGKHSENKNIFSESFLPADSNTSGPLFVINTTEVESGLQCWVSNYKPDNIIFQQKRDLLQEKIQRIRYSTAINFSSRFPLLSPAARIGGQDAQHPRLHYLDGGYVENTGEGSMLEILKQLKENDPVDFSQVIPIVISLQFSDSGAEPTTSIRTFNELSEIVNVVYNTRAGRSQTAMVELENFVESHNMGFIIDQPIEEKNIPMNWVLSKRSIDKVIKDIDVKLGEKKEKGIFPKLFSNKEIYYLKKKV